MQQSPVELLAAAECKMTKLTAGCVVILQSAHSIILADPASHMVSPAYDSATYYSPDFADSLPRSMLYNKMVERSCRRESTKLPAC
jgi:hypothetical protein